MSSFRLKTQQTKYYLTLLFTLFPSTRPAEPRHCPGRGIMGVQLYFVPLLVPQGCYFLVEVTIGIYNYQGYYYNISLQYITALLC